MACLGPIQRWWHSTPGCTKLSSLVCNAHSRHHLQDHILGSYTDKLKQRLDIRHKLHLFGYKDKLKMVGGGRSVIWILMRRGGRVLLGCLRGGGVLWRIRSETLTLGSALNNSYLVAANIYIYKLIHLHQGFCWWKVGICSKFLVFSDPLSRGH